MESIDQEQSMNRRVLQALTAIQGDTTRAVSVNEIVQHVAYLMSPDETEFASELFMNSLETLKTVGLIKQTHELEYTLFRYPTSTKKQSKKIDPKRRGRARKKLKLTEELENSDESENILPEIVCISCRTALEEFKKTANIDKEECSLQINTGNNNNTEYTGRKWQFQMPEPIPSADKREV
ncbi:hypothetical protein KR215_007916 [Drosophila sulfurigaster]|nr:hypothetical protein KR215_007916 [Drosophila sulfurigaster]